MAEIKQIVNGDDELMQSCAVVKFTSSELVILANALYTYFKGYLGGFIE